MAAVLSLGSNVGDRRAHLAAGLDVIGRCLPVLAVSPVYETAPIGTEGQRAYLNAVAIVDCDDPQEVWGAARLAEETRGRFRDRRWGPRTLDVDVVAVAGQLSDDPALTLPHPRAHERAFVLQPWLDLDPAAELAGRGPVWWLLRQLPPQQLRRVV